MTAHAFSSSSAVAASMLDAYTCPQTRKHGFASRAKARRFINSRKGSPGFVARNEYRCPSCGQWHITSQGSAR
jgi:hypothetical protein